MTLLHEWEHICRIPDDAPEGAQDGDDHDPCDVCAHARNYGKSHDDLCNAYQQGLISAAEFCKVIKGNDLNGSKNWSACAYANCQTPGEGFEDKPFSGLYSRPNPVDCPPPQ